MAERKLLRSDIPLAQLDLGYVGPEESAHWMDDGRGDCSVGCRRAAFMDWYGLAGPAEK